MEKIQDDLKWISVSRLNSMETALWTAKTNLEILIPKLETTNQFNMEIVRLRMVLDAVEKALLPW